MGISSMQRGPYGAVALGIHRNCISNWIYNNKLALIDNSVFICLVVVVLEGVGNLTSEFYRSGYHASTCPYMPLVGI